MLKLTQPPEAGKKP